MQTLLIEISNMSFIHNISTVARYEARTLRRSWFFRLFALGALFIFTFMNIGVFSPVGEEDWDLVAIPSSVPLINLYLLNIGQAIVVIFLAADFLKRDKKLDTNEVLYTRPMSNLEYILGKTWGILRLFLSLDLVILAIALLINIISSKMTVEIDAYLSYLLIISIPTIIFSLGLAFVLMSAIRNQALTFLVLLGIAALDMFYLWFRMGSIFDYMAFGLPVFKSGLIGFDNLSLIINQRLLYFSLGLGLVFATVLLFSRLPQSKLHRVLTVIFTVISLTIAGVCAWNTYSIYDKVAKTKELVIQINSEFENRNFPDITRADIEITHEGKIIKGKAEIAIVNNNSEPLASYLFSLNPSLEVSTAGTSPGQSEFTRTNHILEVRPAKELQAGHSDTVTIVYEGGINESFCYPEYSDNLKDNPYRIAMVNVSKRQAFLDEDYVLLTPDSHWYPVAGLNYYPTNPARIKIDFSKYTLKVKEEAGLTVISQGARTKSEGYSIFTPENPMTGISLAIGNYTADTLVVDSLTYLAWYFPGNDYYKKDFTELSDTLNRMVSGIMRELETNFSTPYPFRTLNLVEVPVQFHSYPRENTQTRTEVQPSMVLLPEKLATIRNAGFAKRIAQQKKNMARNNQVITDKELQVRTFTDFVRNTFISGEDFRFTNGIAVNEPVRYRLGPSFYFFKNNFYSSEYPVINTVFESHLQKVNQTGRPGNPDALSENDRANLILRDISFSDLLSKSPEGDTIRTVVTVKGDWLFNLLRSKAGTEEFNTWFRHYLDGNKFRKVDLMKLNTDINERFGFEFYPYLTNWYKGKDQPGFRINELHSTQIVIDGRTRYQVTFVVSNSEPVAGLFNVVFRTEGQGAQTSITIGDRGGYSIAMQGRGMETNDISKIVYMDPLESKRIGILLDFEPRTMMINTLFSRNIPGLLNIPIDESARSRQGIKPFEGEISVPLQKHHDPSEIIVDNEDPGFDSGDRTDPSPLKKLLGITKNNAFTYEGVRFYYVPENWQPVVQSSYYGEYVLSAVYTRPASTAQKWVTWSAPISNPGFYDIYTYIGKSADRVTIRRGNPGAPPPPGGGGEEGPFQDMHYRIYHDEGMEEITVDYDNAEGGWNHLGRYYISKDTANVELTNQSQGRAVIADAVKWVKQD